jgi:hypothetical protein
MNNSLLVEYGLICFLPVTSTGEDVPVVVVKKKKRKGKLEKKKQKISKTIL